jgi:hypothetical protein
MSSSFLICFQWFKTYWVCQWLKLYKTSLYFRGQDAMMKYFKLEILMCFKSPITKHWTLLHQTSHIFHVSWPNWACFVMLEREVESYNFLKTLKVEDQGARIQPFLNFKVFWHRLLTLIKLMKKVGKNANERKKQK